MGNCWFGMHITPNCLQWGLSGWDQCLDGMLFVSIFQVLFLHLGLGGHPWLDDPSVDQAPCPLVWKWGRGPWLPAAPWNNGSPATRLPGKQKPASKQFHWQNVTQRQITIFNESHLAHWAVGGNGETIRTHQKFYSTSSYWALPQRHTVTQLRWRPWREFLWSGYNRGRR